LLNDMWNGAFLGNACHLLVDSVSFFFDIFMVLERLEIIHISSSLEGHSLLTIFLLPPSLPPCHLKRPFLFPNHILT
jgi:hypothetical protein